MTKRATGILIPNLHKARAVIAPTSLNCTMLKLSTTVLFCVCMIACNEKPESNLKTTTAIPIQGTWKLLTGTLIEKEDTVVTDYTKDKSFIKIINDSHFSFLSHTLRKDTTDFSAGGGSYTLSGNNYTEHLEYCSAKEWEGHDFSFTVTIDNDTLTQSGVEKIEAQGIDRRNIEKYIRYKK